MTIDKVSRWIGGAGVALLSFGLSYGPIEIAYAGGFFITYAAFSVEDWTA